MTKQRATKVDLNGHKWREIRNLPEDWPNLCREDLRAVHRRWTSDGKLVSDTAKIKARTDRLSVRWAIETGMIERMYNIDQGVAAKIEETGMAALERFHSGGQISSEARSLIEDQRESLELVMDIVGGARELTNFFVRELHQRLTRSQAYCEAEDQFGQFVKVALKTGEWKKSRNNPRCPDGSIHEYCPPEFVQDQMDQLLAWHEEHESVCPEVEAAWLHHRFTQIHPFQDGNGRVARALAGAIFLEAEHLVLVVRDKEHRERYLTALEEADAGDLKPLVDLFADIQIHDLNEAIAALWDIRDDTLVTVAESPAECAGRRNVTGN